MRTVKQLLTIGSLVASGSFVFGTSPVTAQSLASPPSLGGFGGSASNSMAGTSAGGPIIPYAGNFGGFMPYRMGGGGALSFQSRALPMTDFSRTSFSLSSPLGGISSMSGSMARGSGGRPSAISSFSSQSGMAPTGGMRPVSPSMGGTSVMPPNFGYPFYQPPASRAPSGSSGGMPSM